MSAFTATTATVTGEDRGVALGTLELAAVRGVGQSLAATPSDAH